jgi:hypothetical protein
MKERNHLEDLGADRRIILTRVFKNFDGGGIDCIDLAQDSDKWWALVNAVMKIRVLQN